tara:strand:- start:5723 stop:5929 length:207 start_codon:yes stop_codon:yes gene_type:complete
MGDKSFVTALVLLLLLGGLGAHRFYVGKPGTAILFMFTGGGFLIWWIIDLIAILNGSFTDSDGNTLQK